MHNFFDSVTWLGQPRRHLLTTGWSTFVTSKRLVAGDAFVFMRYLCQNLLLSFPCGIILLCSRVTMASERAFM